jgi:hypothetical protein
MSLHPTAVGLDKSRTIDEPYELNLLEEALKLIDELFAFRLVDRIARPRDMDAKQKDIDRFGVRMRLLHEKMYRIRNELTESRPTENQYRNKSLVATATNFNQVDWKKYIRLIELRYTEVLMEGSFKHTQRICELVGLKFVGSLEVV